MLGKTDRGRAGREGARPPRRRWTRCAGAPPHLPRQPAQHHAAAGRADAARAGRADRAVRAPRVHQRRALGHQLLRPVGRRTGQGAVQPPAAAPARTRRRHRPGCLHRRAAGAPDGLTRGMKIVFDFAGVLFSWQPLALLQRELPHLAPRRRPAPGTGWRRSSRATTATGATSTAARSTCPTWCERIARRTGLARGRGAAVVDAVPRELQPVPDTVALLRRLRRPGRRCTSCPTCRRPMPTTWNAATISCGWFGDGIFSARVQLIKPEPAIFDAGRAALRAARRRAGVPGRPRCPTCRPRATLGWQARCSSAMRRAPTPKARVGWC